LASPISTMNVVSRQTGKQACLFGNCQLAASPQLGEPFP
jgi:hypothetical protein